MQKLRGFVSDEEILTLDEKYCSHGDTVHYSQNPKVFRGCSGNFMFDTEDIPYLDLQMWYASCNLGYKNKRVSDAVVEQINTLPQIASRFLYDYKVLLSQKIAVACEKRFEKKRQGAF